MVISEPIGPYSRPYRLAKIDGRAKIARLMREIRVARRVEARLVNGYYEALIDEHGRGCQTR